MCYDKDHPHEFTAEYSARDAWEKRAVSLRRQLRIALGLLPLPEKCALNPITTGTIDRGEYLIDRIYFTSISGHYVTGNLYRPAKVDRPLPAVLCPHGHWKDGRLGWASDDMVARELNSGAERFEAAARSPLQARGVTFARNGFLAFLYDMVGFGDSKAIEHATGFTDLDAILQGESFMGLQTWNSIRALDFLASHPSVDHSCIAITGASSGGLQTLMLGSLDDRPACLFAGAMVSTTMQGGCICENALLLRVGTNNVEIAAMCAPKPFGFATADDWTRDFIADGLPLLKSIYSLFNAEDDVAATHVPFGHNDNSHSRALGYEFIRRHLAPDSPAFVEHDFTPLSPKELSVWNDGSPPPGDALNAISLRKQMRVQSTGSVDAWRALTNDDDSNVGTIDELMAGSFTLTCAMKNGEASIEIETDQAVMEVSFPDATFDLSNETKYLGYTLGYNSPTVARRALAILWIIRSIRKRNPNSTLTIQCEDGFGHAGLIAVAIAGRLIDRCLVDLQNLDFDDADLLDLNHILLPGAMKLGGVKNLIALCDAQRLEITGWDRAR